MPADTISVSVPSITDEERSKRLIDAGTFWTERISTDASNAGLAGDDAEAGPVEIAIEAEVEGDLDVLGRIWNR